jgi:hypothetical protein
VIKGISAPSGSPAWSNPSFPEGGLGRTACPLLWVVIPFAIKNLLNEERWFGGGGPPPRGARPPKQKNLFSLVVCGGGPPGGGAPPRLTKYHQLAFRNSLHRIGIILGGEALGSGQDPVLFAEG